MVKHALGSLLQAKVCFLFQGGKIVLAMMGVIEIKLHEKLADEVMGNVLDSDQSSAFV